MRCRPACRLPRALRALCRFGRLLAWILAGKICRNVRALGVGNPRPEPLVMTPPNRSGRRDLALSDLTANSRTQVLIIGGGINGAAVFRDLALQGVDCLLVDKGDWCAGTSAAPSRLIHGGLKYLE